MPSQIDIANMALGQIGVTQAISSFNDSSAAAVACKLFYSVKMDGLMRAAPWNFTRKTDLLTLLRQAIDPTTGEASDDPPAPPFLYEYLYPTDCLDARFIPRFGYGQPTGTVPLTTATTPIFIPPVVAQVPANMVIAHSTNAQGANTKVILTNEPLATLVYTARIDDPNLWDPNFIEAAVAVLAATLVNPLARNASLLKQNADMARQIVADARTSDGNEGLNSQDHIPDWLAIRGGGGDGGIACNGQWGGWGWFPMTWPDGLSF